MFDEIPISTCNHNQFDMCCRVMILLICIPLSCNALNHSSSSWPIGLGSNPAGDIFILKFSLPHCSEQLSEAHANEIKHDP